MKRNLLKWSALILSIFFACVLSTGCGGSGKINAPFENSYCNGKDLDSIVSELQEAGFTNIQTEAQESAASFNANNVISVQIGSNTMYNTANSWKADVPIVIKYYEYTGDTTSEPTVAPTSDSIPEPTEVNPDSDSEILKETVLMYCSDTYDCVKTAEYAYLDYVDTFAYKVDIGEDAYALSSGLFDQLNECLIFHRELDSSAVKELDGFADFDYYASAYISGMMAPPQHVMDALDGKDNINNYDSQKTAELISSYRSHYRESLVTFLESVGYEWDNVSSWFYDWE